MIPFHRYPFTVSNATPRRWFLSLYLLSVTNSIYADNLQQTPSEENFPLKLEVTLTSTKRISDGSKLSVRIVNQSDRRQAIGLEVCGMHGVNSYIVNDPALRIIGGGSCRSNLNPPRELSLEPSETYEQNCTILLNNNVKDGPLSFQIGLKNNGYILGWSPLLKVTVVASHPKDQVSAAESTPNVQWLGGELPFQKMDKRTEFPLKAATVVLVPVKQLAANEGHLLIKTAAGEKEPAAMFHDYWIKAVGVVQRTPDADAIVIHYYIPINHEAKDEYLVWYAPGSGDLVWRRYENYWKKGDPKTTTSKNYDAPTNREIRQLLDHLAAERLR